MSQNLLVLPTTGTVSGTQLVTLVNQALDTLNTIWSGASTPATPEAYQLWQDTSISPPTLRQYDGTQWVPLGVIDTTNHLWLPPIGGGSGSIGSANSCDLGSKPQSFLQITGTTQIDDFGASMKPGQVKIVEFAGALTLQNNSNVILPAGANITTAAGDVAIVTCVGAGTPNICRAVYAPASGKALVAPSTASQGFVNGLIGNALAYWPYGTSGTAAVGTPSLTLSNGNRATVGHIVGCAGATVGWSRVASPFASPRTAYAVQLAGQASVTDTFLRFVMSGQRAAQFAGRTCTFMIRVKTSASVSGTPTIASKYPTAFDNWSSSTADLAATNMQALSASSEALLAYTLSVSAGAINGYEIVVDFGAMLGGSGRTLAYGEFDCRETDGATTGLAAPTYAPEIPPGVQDTIWCQERFLSSYDNGTAPGAATKTNIVSGGNIAGLIGNASYSIMGFVAFRVTMRADPTVGYFDSAGSASKYSDFQSGSWSDGNTVSGGYGVMESGQNGFDFTAGVASGPYGWSIHYTADADILGA